MSIAVGAALPAATFKHMTDAGPADVTAAELFGSGKTALFAVPGAFTPTCTNSHMPSFVKNVAALKDKGVDRIVCVTVNDPFVAKAWGEATGATAVGVQIVTDPKAEFVSALGLTFDGAAVGLGVRAKRFSMLVEDGAVKALNVEDSPGEATCSTGEALLEQM